MKLRLEDLNKYLPLALAIEKEKIENVKIKASGEKIKWKQTPIVIQKYQDRAFDGNYWSVEILHLVWLKANELLNSAYLLAQSDDVEGAIGQLKEVAGVFHFLASDRLRVTGGESVPVEFQAPVFNSMMSLSLGQVYALIASKGESDGLPSSALGKLCYTISATYSSALDAINNVKPAKIIHEQYINWLVSIKAYYHACAAIHLAYANKAKGALGKAISLMRVAIKDLNGISKLDRHNIRLNGPADALLENAQKVEPEWTKENFDIQNDYVPTPEESEMFITTSCTIMPNLPQPTPFVMPEPAQIPTA